MAPHIPDRVGSYRLVKQLGRGQYCELWEVERADGERMAMKLLPPGTYHTRERIGFLKHEHAVGRNLDHPNVIRTDEFVSGASGTFLILELFKAANLKEWIHRGFEPLAAHVEDFIRGAATGIGYLHSQGWIHRDVKPDNFLADEQGLVKLIDFNIAQKRRGALTRLLPGKAKVQGTKSYMSPEQIRGQAVDERADVYSFGCLVHELIAGKPPFTGASSQELLNKHLRSRPPSLEAIGQRAAGQGVTTQFAGLVQRMLAKEASGRPASMQAFLDEFARTTIFQTPPRSSADRITKDVN